MGATRAAKQSQELVQRGLDLKADCQKCLGIQRQNCKFATQNWQGCPPPGQNNNNNNNNNGNAWCGNSSWCDTQAFLDRITLNGGCQKNQNDPGYIVQMNAWQVRAAQTVLVRLRC